MGRRLMQAAVVVLILLAAAQLIRPNRTRALLSVSCQEATSGKIRPMGSSY